MELKGVSQVRPWIRYWARFIDTYLWFMLINLIIEAWHLSIDIPNLASAVAVGAGVVFAIFLLWLLVEALLLSKWGYTPGKWLLKVTVTGQSGEKLSFAGALKRALQVYVWGGGLYIPIVAFIANFISYNRLTRKGVTLWDEKGGYKVSHHKIGTVRIISAVIIIAALSWINK